MKITKENIGDVLCKYSDGSRVMITDVSDKLVHFKNEAWAGQFCTDEMSINGTVDRSADARKSFEKNYDYASVLDYAKDAAYLNVLSGNRAEIEEGEKMLSFVLKHVDEYKEILDKNALSRKPELYKAFEQDLAELNPGQKIKFYGMEVAKSETRDTYLVDGKNINSNDLKEHILGIQKVKEKKLPSLTELLNSAANRAGSSGSHSIDKNKIEIDRD